MNCPRCGKTNDAENLFCAKCGLEFAQVQAEPSDQTGARPCYRHPKVMTHLSCGRCEKPLCPKCVVIGPAGPRCRDCARHNVEFRPMAVLHEMKQAGRGLFRYGPWGIYAILLIISMVCGFGRGCFSAPFYPPNPAIPTNPAPVPTNPPENP